MVCYLNYSFIKSVLTILLNPTITFVDSAADESEDMRSPTSRPSDTGKILEIYTCQFRSCGECIKLIILDNFRLY